MLTIEAIQAHIQADANERARRAKLYDYYRGRHDILRRQMQDASKPNNRLCHGFPQLIANAYAGYMFGEPISYTGDDAMLEAANDVFRYNDEQAVNATLGLDCAICGSAVELLYIDRDAEVRFARVNPVGCIAIYDDTIEHALTDLIRYYETYDVVKRTSTGHVEVYDAETVRYFDCGGGFMGGGALHLVREEPHAWGDVPAVVYRNNMDGLGDFEAVLSLIDAYDLMQSEAINDQEYFSDAYLKMHGIGQLTSEDVAIMKQNRVLLMPNDADADWLIKQQSDTLPENIKNRLNSDIHRFSGCPDMTDEHFANNASGVAIRYKLLQFENIASIKEREFKRGLQRRLELLCNIWRVIGRGNFDWRDLQISFKRAMPQNLNEIAQAVGQLGEIISDETKRTLLPLDIDEETERSRLAEELAQKTAIYGPQEVFEQTDEI